MKQVIKIINLNLNMVYEIYQEVRFFIGKEYIILHVRSVLGTFQKCNLHFFYF